MTYPLSPALHIYRIQGDRFPEEGESKMIVVVSDVHPSIDVGRNSKRTGRASEDLPPDPLFQTFMG
jgi:hypothetical protein